MPNRPARFTTADLRRAVKVAEEAGPEWAVEIDPDGTIRLMRPQEGQRSGSRWVGPIEEVVF